MANQEGNKYNSIYFLPHRLRPFHLSTQNVRVQSVTNGNQSTYFLADSVYTKKSNRSEAFRTCKTQKLVTD